MNIKRPTLLIDKQKCLRNIEFMATKAKQHNLIFRPHFKTHQSAEIGEWYRDFGVNCITVSSVKMAEYFAANGWNDITIAFPVNILEIESINELASKIKLNLLVVNIESISFLTNHLEHSVGIFIKVDTGYHRTGISITNGMTELTELTESLKTDSKLIFKGFLTHTGHTYHAENKEEVLKIHHETMQILKQLKQHYINQFPEIQISFGDTPSCSIANDFEGIDEIRPGNFVFYDVMQSNIGSCTYEQIAVALISPVVAKHRERNEIIVHAGAVHLSKDFIMDKTGKKIFGLVCKFENGKWSEPIENMYVKSVSQEHGIIYAEGANFEEVKIGDLLAILPIHSCLTANLMKEEMQIKPVSVCKT